MPDTEESGVQTQHEMPPQSLKGVALVVAGMVVIFVGGIELLAHVSSIVGPFPAWQATIIFAVALFVIMAMSVFLPFAVAFLAKWIYVSALD